MFTVKTFLEKSEINGMGCIAGEFIPKGKIIWKFQDNFDVRINDIQFKRLPDMVQKFVLHFGTYNIVERGYIVCMDNAKYANDSQNPNMKMIDEINAVALKDINDGEEITGNFFYVDELASMKLNVK